MKFRKYNFPHPVLGRGNDFTPSKITQTQDINISEDSNERIYSFTVDPNNEQVQTMMDKQDAVLLCEVNCSYTMFRKVYKSSDQVNSITFSIPINQLRQKVEVKLVVVSNKDGLTYTNAFFNPLYEDSSFTISKGDVIVVCQNFIEHIDQQGINTGDFIKIQEDEEAERTTLEFNRECIIARVPKQEVEKLRVFINNPDFREILINTIFFPILCRCLSKIREENESQYGSRQWFEALKILSHKINNEDYVTEDEVFELAQVILQNPNSRLMDSLQYLNLQLTQEGYAE
jgi:hypothetical protein